MRFNGISTDLSCTKKANDKITRIVSTTKHYTTMPFFQSMQVIVFNENDYGKTSYILNCINIVVSANCINDTINMINDNTLLVYVKTPINAINFALSKLFKSIYVYVENCNNWFVENHLLNECKTVKDIDANLFTYLEKYGKKLRTPYNNYTYFYLYVEDAYNKDLMLLIYDISCEPLIDNRTIQKTRNLYNEHLEFNLRGGVIPLCTINRRWVRGIFYELMWFLKGRTDLEYLHQYNIHIWDANCETPQSGSIVGAGNIGKIYGYQWRNFGGSGFDQIAYIVNLLKTDKNSRRIVLSSWCPPGIFTDSCLPPCHVMYCFNVNHKDELMCHLTQRSSDVGVGLPWNIASASILINLLAKTCGLVPGVLSIILCNAHIYESHQQILTDQYQLSKKPNSYPRIVVNTKKNIDEYEYEDINIIDYNPEFQKNTLPMIV